MNRSFHNSGRSSGLASLISVGGSSDVRNSILGFLPPEALVNLSMASRGTKAPAEAALQKYIFTDYAPARKSLDAARPSIRLELSGYDPKLDDFKSHALTLVRASQRSPSSSQELTRAFKDNIDTGSTTNTAARASLEPGTVLYVGVSHSIDEPDEAIAKRIIQALIKASAQTATSGVEDAATQHQEQEMIRAGLAREAMSGWKGGETGSSAGETPTEYKDAVAAHLQTHLHFISAEQLEEMEGKKMIGTVSEAEQFTTEA